VKFNLLKVSFLYSDTTNFVYLYLSIIRLGDSFGEVFISLIRNLVNKFEMGFLVFRDQEPIINLKSSNVRVGEVCVFCLHSSYNVN